MKDLKETYQEGFDEFEKLEKDLNEDNDKGEVRLLNFAKTLKLLPTVFDMTKAFKEVIGGFKFPETQKITGKVDVDFPVTQNVKVLNPTPAVTEVTAKVTFPKVQEVKGVIKVEEFKKLEEAVLELTELLSNQPKLKPAPDVQKVSIQNWEHVADGGGSGGSPINALTKDKIWLREEFTYTTVNSVPVPTKVEKWDGSIKLTLDYEYDSNDNPVVMSRLIEPNKDIGT